MSTDKFRENMRSTSIGDDYYKLGLEEQLVSLKPRVVIDKIIYHVILLLPM